MFQRSPEFAIPMRNPKLTDADRAAMRKSFHERGQRVMRTFAGFDDDFLYGRWSDLSPEERRAELERVWADGSLSFWIGAFPELLLDEEANKEITAFVSDKIRARIDDPKVADKLIPKHFGFGTKRVPLETKYYEAYNRSNVELVDVSETPIEALTETGLVTKDGKVRDIDVLVLATGFDAGTGALTRIDIRGRGGRSLREDWGKEIRTTLGLQVNGYPNLFTTGAPLAPAAALCNMTTCLQQQVDWITTCIQYLKQNGLNEIEPTPEAEEDWVSYHDAIANATLIAKTDSWYMGSNVPGKQRRLLSFAGGVNTYHQKCEELTVRQYPGFATV